MRGSTRCTNSKGGPWYPDGSSEQHPVAGRMGGYRVHFGDSRDTATFIPLDEEQTNIQGELRALHRALEGHRT